LVKDGRLVAPKKTPKKTVKQTAASRIERLDKQYVWHPFTQMRDWEKEPQVVIASGNKNMLVDVNGKKYIDGVSSLWVNVHGHRKKELDSAITGQLKKIAHTTMLGLSSVPAVELAEKLVSIAPKGLVKVFYSDNGSTAVEVALKMAFQYWQQRGPEAQRKTGFISLTEAYHGDTLGAVSVGGIDLFHAMYRPLLFQARKIETPHCYRCKYGLTYPECMRTCFVHAERTIQKYATVSAALIVEPLIQGAAGMLLQPPGFLKKLRELCTKNNILMIVDEVATGFGRTGKMFACEHEGVTPDFLCTAKGITGGYLPLAATLATEEVYRGFLGESRDNKAFFHGHSYTGNALACAAALANIKLFQSERILDRLKPKITLLTNKLKDMRKLLHVGDVRHRGMMVGIELVRSRLSKEQFPVETNIGVKVMLECRKRGLIIRPLGPVIVFMPPLSITLKELDLSLKIIHDSIKIVTEKAM
jgi:adenosylmethionine-8-amino-7-oxononanoate aminotransferase